MVLSACLEVQSFCCAFGIEKTNEFINLDRPTTWKLKAQRGWEERKEEANEGNMLISTRARIGENHTVMQEGSGRRREEGGGGGGSRRRGGGRGRIPSATQSKYLTPMM